MNFNTSHFMMHTIRLAISIAVFFSLSVTTYSQSVYYDALYLKDSTENRMVADKVVLEIGTDVKKEVIKILKKYSKTPNPTPAEIENELADNPFINMSGLAQNTTELKSLFATVPKGSLQMSRLPQLKVTNFADGLARFLVSRMKEELNVMFFDHFNKFLKAQPDTKALFPKTYFIMLLMSDRIYDYQSYLPTLREAFEQDLSGLLHSANEWVNDSPQEKSILKFFKDKPEALACVQLGIRIAQKVESGTKPGDILHEVKDDSLRLDKIHLNVRPILQTTDLFSQSLRSNNPRRYWITEEQFGAFENEIFVRIYLGLLYQQSKNQKITFTNKKTLDGLMRDATNAKEKIKAQEQIREMVTSARQYMVSIKAQLIQIDESISLARENIEGAGLAGYFALSKKISGIIDETIKSGFLGSLIHIPQADIDLITQMEFYLEHSINLLSGITLKSYSAAVFEVALILNQATGDSSKKFTDGFIRYGTFMATVATATTSKEVQDAIEAVALPPGSALIKRSTPLNISINSYVGFHGGTEYLRGGSGWSPIYGMSAPVGLALSTDIRNKKKKQKGSISAFISLIDIGAVASFRIEDDSTQQLPEIKLGNIFAPGIYVVWGIGKTPLSIGGGWQKGPQLRAVNVPDPANPGQFKNELKDGYRWSIFIAVDIPLFNLYTKTR